MTGYDETAEIQFVDQVMFTQTKRTKTYTKKLIKGQICLAMSLVMKYHLWAIFQSEPIFIGKKDLAGTSASDWLLHHRN